MIYNVIPINYAGGLGGQFLASFLYAARENKLNFVFSKNGNSHESDKDGGTPRIGIGQDPTGEKSINYLLEYAKTVPADITIYPHGHYADPDLLMQYVNKQIKIYVEPEYTDEIMGVWMSKHPSTRDLFENFIKNQNYKNHEMIIRRRISLPRFARLYNNCPDLEPRMLNISWGDMLYNDQEELISKLHTFTEIPKENFSRDKLSEWRMLTHETVDKLRQSALI